jgi:hypothetical protein
MPVQTNAKTRISFDIRGPFQNWSIAKTGHFSNRQCRPIVNAQGGVLFCQAPSEPYGGCSEMRDAGTVADHERPLPHCSEVRANN